MKIFTCLFIVMMYGLSLEGQMKLMDQSAYSEWNTIRSSTVSDNGVWVKYHIKPGKGDASLRLYNTITKENREYPRVKSSSCLLYTSPSPRD